MQKHTFEEVSDLCLLFQHEGIEEEKKTKNKPERKKKEKKKKRLCELRGVGWSSLAAVR